nr:hypothetical protein [Tanacetum cinerariifolium]
SSIISKCFSTTFTNHNSGNLTKQTFACSKVIPTFTNLCSTGTSTTFQTFITSNHNLYPIELIFSTHPSSLHALFDSLEDLPPKTTNPHPSRPSFESMECLVNQPPPLLSMDPPLLSLPPHLPTLGLNNPFPLFTHEMFCKHFQHTQVVVNNLRDEMRFILSHILDRLNVLSHNN